VLHTTYQPYQMTGHDVNAVDMCYVASSDVAELIGRMDVSMNDAETQRRLYDGERKVDDEKTENKP